MPRSPSFQPDPSQAAAIGPSFRVADARQAGVSTRQLSGSKLTIPTPGVRSPAPLDIMAERAAAFALVLPDDVVFSHLTAARLWGLALPWHLDQPAAPLEVIRHSGKARIDRAGCIGHRGLEHRLVATAHRLRVTGVADTWCDIIEKYHARLSLADAVVMGDAAVELLHRTGPLVDAFGRLVFDRPEVHPQALPGTGEWWSDPATAGVWELCQRVADRGGFRGVTLAREALHHIRPRVWSPMETRSRLVIVGGGIREPRLNVSVRDVAGRVIVIGDLVWEEEQAVGDYNGATHEIAASRQRDNSQRLRLEDQDWWYIEIYKEDLNGPTRRRDLVRRIAGGLRRPRRGRAVGF